MGSATKKRKLNITQLQPIPYLLCNVCKDKVYNYMECCNQWIYCGYDCYSVLMLNYTIDNNEYKSFNEYFF